jgi:hypothetical protein
LQSFVAFFELFSAFLMTPFFSAHIDVLHNLTILEQSGFVTVAVVL